MPSLPHDTMSQEPRQVERLDLDEWNSQMVPCLPQGWQEQAQSLEPTCATAKSAVPAICYAVYWLTPFASPPSAISVPGVCWWDWPTCQIPTGASACDKQATG